MKHSVSGNHLLPSQVKYIAESAYQIDMDAFLVGGVLRDSILGTTNPDIDITVIGSATDMGKKIAQTMNLRWFPLDTKRDICRVVSSDSRSKIQIDIASVQNGISFDVSKRDFTINTLALNLKTIDFAGEVPQFKLSDVIDNHGGVKDLQNGLLKMTSEKVFSDDPLRILRAARMEAQNNFRMDENTKTQIKKNSVLISEVSGERIREEFLKLLSMKNTVQNLKKMDELGILTNIIPELEPTRKTTQNPNHHWNVLEHMLQTAGQVENIVTGKITNMGPFPEFIGKYIPTNAFQKDYLGQNYSDGCSRLTFLKLSGILHDIGKPITKSVESNGKIRFLNHDKLGGEMAYSILKRLKFSNTGIELVRNQIENHLRPSQISNPGQKPTFKAIRKYYRDTDNASIDILYLNMADYLATKGPNLTRKEWSDHCDIIKIIMDSESSYKKAINQDRLLSGHDIMVGLRLKPGPLIGTLIKEVEEARLDGVVANKKEALELIRHRINSGEYIA
ncbi:HD domain-containing protein [Chloroflexi bacterium]|nr:HD domain-containing protein [Chloroflexota bacterium]